MKSTSDIRAVEQITTAHRQLEGAGFPVRRPIPAPNLDHVDPFLLIDEMGPVDYAPGKAVGAPDHPHRGFETVTYVLEGGVEHEDSAGHRGTLGPGDVQWMTAGGGIIHSETPTPKLLDRGGRVHGFQIWVNLPARLKMTTPRYQELAAASIPRARTADGKAEVTIIAGSALGTGAVIETHTPIVFQDWKLESDGDVSVAVPRDHRVVVYVFEGTLIVGDDESVVRDGQMAILGSGDVVRLRAPTGKRGRALLLGGVPLRETVARYGPFVMNTDREILQAVRDYQSGQMGEITRTARVG